MTRSDKKLLPERQQSHLLEALVKLTHYDIPPSLRLGAERQITRLKLGVFDN